MVARDCLRSEDFRAIERNWVRIWRRRRAWGELVEEGEEGLAVLLALLDRSSLFIIPVGAHANVRQVLTGRQVRFLFK